MSILDELLCIICHAKNNIGITITLSYCLYFNIHMDNLKPYFINQKYIDGTTVEHIFFIMILYYIQLYYLKIT